MRWIRKLHRLTLLGSLVFLLAQIIVMPAQAETQHSVFFPKTDYELHVYRIDGAEIGKTLMIIGGIQGDEPGGYLAADLYADMALQKGNLIVVPRANFLSIMRNKRAINRDMNRRFNSAQILNYEDKVVEILKDLISQSDFLLNLHDGSGFYSPTWESKLVNPKRYGQSIITDADDYLTPDGRVLQLGKIAIEVTERINTKIRNPRHQFRFNNHNTFSKNTKHIEQRMSATYFALSQYHIPAFGVETSKEIRNLEQKVRYQTMVINAFLDTFGIVPENPKVALASPKLHYLVVSIDGVSQIVRNQGKLLVPHGVKFEVERIEANYSRGLSVDLLGMGTTNDLKRSVLAEQPITVIVRKDGFKFGSVKIAIAKTGSPVQVGKVSPAAKEQAFFKYLILELNGKTQVLGNGESLKVVRGDRLELVEVVAEGVLSELLRVNFRGYVADMENNTGEDRGYVISTSKDLWVKYSKNKQGKIYTITVSNGKVQLGVGYVEIVEPTMDYIVLQGGQKGNRWYSDGEIIQLDPRETLKLVDVKTNVPGNEGVKVYQQPVAFKNNGQLGRLINIGESLVRDDSVTSQANGVRLVITREGIVIGTTEIAYVPSVVAVVDKL